MKIQRIVASNFGSFEFLEFKITDLSGPVVIEGDTGSGKSTLLDTIVWGLYGETSKSTKSDEIRSWGEANPTVVVVDFQVNNQCYSIYRTRGDKNDLYIEGHTQLRGTSLKDTQKIIDKIIGLTFEEFTSCVYFTQFSDSETFFTSKPSDRRETLEKLVDTESAILLGTRCLELKKEVRQELIKAEYERHGAQCRIETIQDTISKRQKESIGWEEDRKNTIRELEDKLASTTGVSSLKEKEAALALEIDRFTSLITASEYEENEVTTSKTLEYASLSEKLKEKDLILASLSKEASVCPTCESPLESHKKHELLLAAQSAVEGLKETRSALIRDKEAQEKKLNRERLALTRSKQQLVLERNGIMKKLDKWETEESIFAVRKMLEVYKDSKNFHEAQIEKMKAEAKEKHDSLVKLHVIKQKKAREIAHLELLYDLSIKLRSRLLTNSIVAIQTEINRLLEKHFDSEIKLTMFMLDGDSLEVKIERNGNECSFKALSGGQRCILKLCLWLSMKKAVENKNHTRVNLVMLDESLHGLSDRLKQQAYSLIEEISSIHSPVLVIDHNEGLKSCFSQKLTVYQYEGRSKIRA